MAPERPIGIDLGTTFSAAAWVDESGHSNMIRNAEGELLTPSVVLFGENGVAVGKDARTAISAQPDLVVEWAKRDMGQPFYSRPVGGRNFPPEVIQACILRKLKQDIVQTVGSVDRVVITVPAYFDEPRRKATADVGTMAGLKVLDIVNEPTAAALAFGESLGYLSPEMAPQREETLFVFDLGGGTFDATLLRLGPNHIETIATDGDVQLGGHDWDLRMAEYVADQFQKAHGHDPRQSLADLNRVLAAAIEAKHTLSSRSRAIVRIELDDFTLETPIARTQFEEMTADLLERTAYTSRQLLVAANMEWKDVTRLLLVGGSTRMPMVVDMLRQMSGMEPDHTVNPDEAVARGAALYAAYLLAKESRSGGEGGLTITNVNSHSLGVEGIAPETLRKTNVVLIPRNSPLPAKVSERFATQSENQRSIAIQVLEGESSLPSACTLIGRMVIRDLPEGLPKNWPVEVVFEYGTNGRLKVEAVVPGTQKAATLELERAVGMSSERLAQWEGPIGEAAGLDAFGLVTERAVPRQSAASMTHAASESPAAESTITKALHGLAAEAASRETPPTSGMESMILNALELPEFGSMIKEAQRLSEVAPPWAEPAPSAAPTESAVTPADVVPSPSPQAVVVPPGPPVKAGKPSTLAAAPREDFDSVAPASPETDGFARPTSIAPVRRIGAANEPTATSWLVRAIGHLIAAVLGLVIGYLLLSWLRPGLLPSLW
jgi:molecular chaperone DnaK